MTVREGRRSAIRTPRALRRAAIFALLLPFFLVLSGCLEMNMDLDLTKPDKPSISMEVLAEESLISLASDEWKNKVQEMKDECAKAPTCKFEELTRGSKQGFRIETPAVFDSKGTLSRDGIEFSHTSKREGGKVYDAYRINLDMNQVNDTSSSMFPMSLEGTFTVRLPKDASDVQTNGKYNAQEQKITWKIGTSQKEPMEFAFAYPAKSGFLGALWGIGIAIFVLAVLVGVVLLVFFLLRRKKENPWQSYTAGTPGVPSPPYPQQPPQGNYPQGAHQQPSPPPPETHQAPGSKEGPSDN